MSDHSESESSSSEDASSFRTMCRYCHIITRFYPYIGHCKVCGIPMCIKCIKREKLFVRFVFSDQVFDEMRCHVHRTQPMRITMAMYDEMTEIVMSGKYRSDDSSDSTTTSSDSEVDVEN